MLNLHQQCDNRAARAIDATGCIACWGMALRVEGPALRVEGPALRVEGMA